MLSFINVWFCRSNGGNILFLVTLYRGCMTANLHILFQPHQEDTVVFLSSNKPCLPLLALICLEEKRGCSL